MPDLNLYRVSKRGDYSLVVRAATGSRAVTLARACDPSPDDDGRRADYAPTKILDTLCPPTEGEAVWDSWTCAKCGEGYVATAGCACGGSLVFATPASGALALLSPALS